MSRVSYHVELDDDRADAESAYEEIDYEEDRHHCPGMLSKVAPRYSRVSSHPSCGIANRKREH